MQFKHRFLCQEDKIWEKQTVNEELSEDDPEVKKDIKSMYYHITNKDNWSSVRKSIQLVQDEKNHCNCIMLWKKVASECPEEERYQHRWYANWLRISRRYSIGWKRDHKISTRRIF